MLKHTENISKGIELRRKRNIYVINIKLNIESCHYCNRKVNEDNHMAFHFDHLDPLEKNEGISVLVNSTYASEAIISKEIDKCQLLCANCHRIRTLEQFGFCQYLIL